MIIDATPALGKTRLRVGDTNDLELLPDSVYISTLEDCNQNVSRATTIIAQYILAMLTSQTHQKLAQIEVYGGEWFANYRDFIKLTILNPNLSQLAPVPYAGGLTVENPLTKFNSDWLANMPRGTERDLLSDQAFGQTL